MRGIVSLMVGLLAGTFYGLLVRYLFGTRAWAEAFGGLLTLTFVFFVPIAVGFISLVVSEWRRPLSGGARVGVPLLAVSAVMISAVVIVAWELIICAIMLAPVWLTLGLLGGGLGVLVSDRRRQAARPGSLLCMALLPFVLAPLESLSTPAPTVRPVETFIDIAAAPAAVWEQIIRVPPIAPEELTPGLATRLGLPRPVEATLSREGVGGVREASFEGGLLFTETVTVWEPERALAFSIEPTTQLEGKINLASRAFAVREGHYRLEPLPDGRVRLHLGSTHRLATHFNAYGGLWTDAIMRDIQERILEVVKRRAEARA